MDILAVLHDEETRLQEQIAAINRAINTLSGVGTFNGAAGSPRGRRAGWKMTAAARAKIAKAARERWAKIKAKKK